MVTLWSFFSLFITCFYNSNFRAVLMSTEFEKPVNRHEDVVERGTGAYSVGVTYRIFLSSPLIPTRMKEALKEVEKTKDGLYVPRMANGKPGLPEYVSK